jgi:hypothetical protein
MGLGFAPAFFLLSTKIVRNIDVLNESQNKARCLSFGRAKMTISNKQRKYLEKIGYHEIDKLNGWFEPFLMSLGCETVESIDYSDFESAVHQLNLNEDLLEQTDSRLKPETYDLVLDYGTSEHVFNPAMSLFNGTQLLKIGGLLNLQLPCVGWVDHGFFQFSPTFFLALDRPELELERLYFYVYDQKSSKIQMWDGMGKEFRDHVHGAFDGSFAANCLEFLDKPVSVWAVYRKKGVINKSNFLVETMQEVYKNKWDDKESLSKNSFKVFIYTLPNFLRKPFFKVYLNSISLDLRKKI